MRVAINDSKGLIGHADLIASDPPMGVASGVFYPTSAYSRADHANIIDGDYNGDRGVNLRVLSITHGQIESVVVCVQDHPTLNELTVDVIGITRPAYDTLFADDPGFQAHWARGAS